MSQAGLMLLFSAEAQPEQRLLTDAKQKHGGGAAAGRLKRERVKAEARLTVREGRGGWEEGDIIEPV